jgi:hypothetical protein
MDGLFSIIKEECVRGTLYASHDEARLEIFTYKKCITIEFVGIPRLAT